MEPYPHETESSSDGRCALDDLPNEIIGESMQILRTLRWSSSFGDPTWRGKREFDTKLVPEDFSTPKAIRALERLDLVSVTEDDGILTVALMRGTA